MRRFAYALPLALLLFASIPAHAAGLPLLDPNFHIVPDAHTINPACPPGAPLSYGAMLQLIQNLMNAGIVLGIIMFVIVLTYAGASFMMNPTNPEARSHARGMIINVVVGMVILLSAWLVVDFIMKTIYNPTAVLSGGIKLGGWNEILAPEAHDPGCILATNPTAIGGFIGGGLTHEFGGGNNQVLSTSGPGACNATTVSNAAATGGVHMTAGEANTFACLAQPESVCGAHVQNYSWQKANGSGNASTAYGAFQVTLKGNSSCYENTACYKAANITSGQLNCASAFDRHGFPISGDTLNRCTQAASNLSCSAAAADCVYRKSGNYNAWLADSHNSVQAQCIARYGNT